MTGSAASALDCAIDEIRARGSLRTHALAEILGIGETAVDAMLAPAVADGRLITCGVQIGERNVVEYRASLNGGGKLTGFQSYHTKPAPAPRAEVVLAKIETAFGSEPSAEMKPLLLRGSRVPAPANPHAETRREEAQVTLIERAQAFFKKHGPMTRMQVAAIDASLADKLKELAAGATIGRLGGKARGVVYGLPDQSLADRKATEPKSDKPRRAIHKVRKAKKRVGGGVRCNAT